MELNIEIKDVAPPIKFDYEGLLKQVQTASEKYETIVYDEEQFSDAKADRATLNKFELALLQARRDTKKRCLEQYDIFEKKINKVIVALAPAKENVEGQIKKVEDEYRFNKAKECQAMYAEIMGEYAQLVPYERLYKEQWLNRTYKAKQIKEDIEYRKNRLVKDLDTISALDSDYTAEIKQVYLETFDIGAALNKNQQLIETANRIARIASMQPHTVQPEPIPAQPQTQQVQEKKYRITIQVIVTDAQKTALKDFFLKNNIKYGRIQ